VTDAPPIIIDEYGPPAVLKNAIDWVYPEWRRKAVGFVSWGSVMGARAVQQLREIAIELQLAPIWSFQGGDVDAGLAELEGSAQAMIDDLLWWTSALKIARAAGLDLPRHIDGADHDLEP
jgi:NAD(P)H-dependent FMN reductase